MRVQNLELATKAVADSYGAFSIIATLNGAILFGWIILAVGAYLSGTLGLLRSIALALMSALMIGALKGALRYRLSPRPVFASLRAPWRDSDLLIEVNHRIRREVFVIGVADD